ncbi:hypothetical protein [Brevibacillus sp. MER 51]|uniref:hypothetical protein n=1 Tax=Brevibacillus sp. MER 51 TaxID=2939560 RepID=UPI00203D1A84|nr:hypothetical protein [Brevibacillus sp. MER 51]MCM3144394.1 hypothetical protein [Brevibacillus sp. MER 51]
MNIHEFLDKICSSNTEDWTLITCWGAGGGPSYRDQLSVWTNGGGNFEGIELESHGMVASLKSDLSISIAWGLTDNDNYQSEWVRKFPDERASSSFVDFFYNGMLVFRDVYVSVDGGRCSIPQPNLKFNDSELVARTVPRQKYEFFALLNAFESTYDYHSYFDRTGIQIVDEPWE